MDWGLVAALAALLVPVALFARALLQDTKPRKGPAKDNFQVSTANEYPPGNHSV